MISKLHPAASAMPFTEALPKLEPSEKDFEEAGGVPGGGEPTHTELALGAPQDPIGARAS